MAVVITGLKEAVAGLKAMDEESLKKFRSVINKELNGAKIDAQSLVKDLPPLSGWNTAPPKKGQTRGGVGWPAWNAGEIRSKIRVSKASGKVRKGDYTTSAGALINADPAGVIFEISGRKGLKGSTKNGSYFKTVINNRYGSASRVIWKIVDRDKEKIERNFENAVNEAKADLQRALDKPK